MNNRDDIKEKLINELNKLKVHNLTANKKEMSVRCCFCGDSVKNSRSSHLYINIDPEEGEPFVYYCQRCKSHGYVNSEFLKSLRINDNNLVLNIEKDLIECNKRRKVNYRPSLNKSNLKLPKIRDTKENRIKLSYINKRLNTKLSYKDLNDLKIIFSLYDVLNENKVKRLTCKDFMGDILNNLFIGFVSYDNNYIVMRNVSKKQMTDMRYVNYNIYNKYDNTKKFYIIPNKINILNKEVTVVITEGIFDLLGVYFNIEKKRKDIIYVAVCGIGYNNVIQEIIRMGFLNINLKIYCDNDQDMRLYKSLKNQFIPFIQRIELYTNTINKDFGDWSKEVKIRKTLI